MPHKQVNIAAKKKTNQNHNEVSSEMRQLPFRIIGTHNSRHCLIIVTNTKYKEYKQNNILISNSFILSKAISGNK